MIRSDDDLPYGVRYEVGCNRQWRTREVRLEYLGAHSVHVITDGEGHWFDMLAGRQHIPQLEGCLDIDIGVTPFTNSLPIMRLALAEGVSRKIRVAYVPLPSQIEGGRWLPWPANQRYTCLKMLALSRYEGMRRNFSADLPVDGHGLVCDYPGAFRRLA